MVPLVILKILLVNNNFGFSKKKKEHEVTFCSITLSVSILVNNLKYLPVSEFYADFINDI